MEVSQISCCVASKSMFDVNMQSLVFVAYIHFVLMANSKSRPPLFCVTFYFTGVNVTGIILCFY
jgi:hypothetical protein